VTLGIVAIGSGGCRAAASESMAASDQPEPREDPCRSALFCDDFEHHPVGLGPQVPWVVSAHEAEVAIDTARAFSGTHSVHVLADTAASYRRGYIALHGSPVFPAASAEMYGRVMVWLDAAPVSPPDQPPVHWTIIQGEGLARQGDHNALFRYGGQHQGGAGLMANYETTPPVRTDCWKHSQTRIPVGQWACFEWHFVQASNEMQLWLNGNELVDLHVKERGEGCLGDDLGGTWEAPAPFRSLYLGWERYQTPTEPNHVWIDDVAVGLSRIGCPAPV